MPKKVRSKPSLSASNRRRKEDDQPAALSNRLSVWAETIEYKGASIDPHISGGSSPSGQANIKLRSGGSLPVLYARTEVGYIPGQSHVVIQSFVPRGDGTEGATTDVLVLPAHLIRKFSDAVFTSFHDADISEREAERIRRRANGPRRRFPIPSLPLSSLTKGRAKAVE